MRRYRDVIVVLAMFGFVWFAAATLSGPVDRRFGALGDFLRWLTR